MREHGHRVRFLAMRERAEATVAAYRERTRAIASRLSAPDRDADEENDQDNDVVASWMADPRGEARRHPADGVLDRLDRGETTWDDVLSGRATDRESVALREFLRDRVDDVRAGRRAR